MKLSSGISLEVSEQFGHTTRDNITEVVVREVLLKAPYEICIG
jgi:hypothetical protein